MAKIVRFLHRNFPALTGAKYVFRFKFGEYIILTRVQPYSRVILVHDHHSDKFQSSQDSPIAPHRAKFK